MSFNASITGRVTQEPELKFGQSGGKAILSLNVAINHRRKNQQSGQYEDSGTTWMRVVLFGAQAENAAERVRVKDMVSAYGRVETREFQKKDGSKGTSLEMVADELGVTVPRWAEKNTQPAQSAPSDPWAGAPSTGGSWATPDQLPAWG